MVVGAYPGTFDPPTVAHLAIAEAAWRQGGLDRVELVISRDPLGKDPVAPSFEHRLEVLASVAAARPWLGVAVTDARLIADIARGYSAIVMGADKWAQVRHPSWYGGSLEARDAAITSLPRLLVAPRAGVSVPIPDDAVVLDIDAPIALVSSTEVRSGRFEWIAREAAEFDARTGAWSDPDRYLRSLPD